MKVRVAIILSLLFAAAFVWWFFHPAADPNKFHAAASSASAHPIIPDVASHPVTQISPPKLPAVSSAQATATAASTTSTPTPKVDPQKDMSTVIPDLANLLLAGDLVSAFENYTAPDDFAQIPTDRVTQVEDQLRSITQDPSSLQRVQMMSRVLELLRFESPEYNDTKDAATYALPSMGGINPLPALHFEKVDDRWYIRRDDINNLGSVLDLKY
ncbi:MAG TPA: hypothetical protein VK737_10825 [Opitutales bacterium]|jgi:hypothetical protein|nr:hypothetical protein [Opitutales bacterium]